MILEIVKQFNWLDVFILLFIVRMIYIGARTGFFIELFKLVGIVFTIYISFHYYTLLGDFVKDRYAPETVPIDFLDFFIFVFLAVAVYLIFVLLRNVVFHFIKMETVPLLSKWGGLFLGILRGVFTISLIIYVFAISCMPYLITSAQRSYLGPRLLNISVTTYTRIWDGTMSKFNLNEKINNVVLENQKNFFNEAD